MTFPQFLILVCTVVGGSFCFGSGEGQELCAQVQKHSSLKEMLKNWVLAECKLFWTLQHCSPILFMLAAFSLAKLGGIVLGGGRWDVKQLHDCVYISAGLHVSFSMYWFVLCEAPCELLAKLPFCSSYSALSSSLWQSVADAFTGFCFHGMRGLCRFMLKYAWIFPPHLFLLICKCKPLFRAQSINLTACQ